MRAATLFTGSIVIAFAAWQFLSTVVFNPFLIPPPLVVLQTMVPMAQNGEIFRHVAISLARVAVGFVAGCAAAIILGVVVGRVKLVNDLLDPVIELLRYLSPTAMIPIAVIWFGIGETSKYFLIFWGTFFIVLINTTAGVMRAPVIRQRAAQCLGASELQIFLLVVIPSAAPYIVTGMRIAMASLFTEGWPKSTSFLSGGASASPTGKSTRARIVPSCLTTAFMASPRSRRYRTCSEKAFGRPRSGTGDRR